MLIQFQFYKMNYFWKANYSFLLITLLLSLYYSNSSYNGLLFPSSVNHLVSYDQDYNLSKQILFDSKHQNSISSNYIMFPNKINIGVFDYAYDLKSYSALFSLYVINYGDFDDSESGYTFSSKDYIIKNKFSKKINNNIYSSFDLKYIYSYIDTYSSNAIASKFSLYYYNKRFLLQGFLDNYGLVINQYTQFKEKLPITYGHKIMFIPKYINAVFTLKHNYFNNYSTFNISGELFLFQSSSVIVGFSSLSKELYYGEFYNDFFTGMSFGLSTEYKNYLMSIGFKNLGAIGLSSSFTITRLIN